MYLKVDIIPKGLNTVTNSGSYQSYFPLFHPWNAEEGAAALWAWEGEARQLTFSGAH